MSGPVQRIDRSLGRAAVLARLRALMPAAGSVPEGTVGLPLGAPAIDGHLPTGGLPLGLLHELAPKGKGDGAAAFGFMAALLGSAITAGRVGLLVISERAIAEGGEPYGHGLHDLGLDPGRLLLLRTVTERQALWAMEEALRLRAAAAVAGWMGAGLDLKASRRLNLAAEGSGALLLLLRPAGAEEANAATTRWRVGAAPAARDRFGCFERWRWRVALERCRHGRPGEWIVELSDGAHPFRLAGPLADPALSAHPEPHRRAG